MVPLWCIASKDAGGLALSQQPLGIMLSVSAALSAMWMLVGGKCVNRWHHYIGHNYIVMALSAMWMLVGGKCVNRCHNLIGHGYAGRNCIGHNYIVMALPAVWMHVGGKCLNRYRVP